jgi:hypothetical protein
LQILDNPIDKPKLWDKWHEFYTANTNDGEGTNEIDFLRNTMNYHLDSLLHDFLLKNSKDLSRIQTYELVFRVFAIQELWLEHGLEYTAAYRLSDVRYYAVAVGSETGIFTDSDKVRNLTESVPGNMVKVFDSLKDAEEWYAANHINGVVKRQVLVNRPPLNKKK